MPHGRQSISQHGPAPRRPLVDDEAQPAVGERVPTVNAVLQAQARLVYLYNTRMPSKVSVLLHYSYRGTYFKLDDVDVADEIPLWLALFRVAVEAQSRSVAVEINNSAQTTQQRETCIVLPNRIGQKPCVIVLHACYSGRHNNIDGFP